MLHIKFILISMLPQITHITSQNLHSNCNASDNQMWYDLGPGCEQSCSNLNRKCDIIKITAPGCYCKPGHVVDEETGECVNGNEYCGNCKPNEYYTRTGPNCERFCAELGEPCDGEDSERTRSGCFCDDGFARTKSGKCIHHRKCQCEYCIIIKCYIIKILKFFEF